MQAVVHMSDNQSFQFGSGSAHGEYNNHPHHPGTHSTASASNNTSDSSSRKHGRSTSTIDPPPSIVKKKSRMDLQQEGYGYESTPPVPEYTTMAPAQPGTITTAATKATPSPSPPPAGSKQDDFVVVISPEGQVTHATPSVQNYLGYHYSALQNHTIAEFVHPSDRDRFLSNINTAMTSNTQLHTTYKLKTSSNVYRLYDIVGRPFFDGAQSPSQLVPGAAQVQTVSSDRGVVLSFRTCQDGGGGQPQPQPQQQQQLPQPNQGHPQDSLWARRKIAKPTPPSSREHNASPVYPERPSSASSLPVENHSPTSTQAHAASALQMPVFTHSPAVATGVSQSHTPVNYEPESAPTSAPAAYYDDPYQSHHGQHPQAPPPPMQQRSYSYVDPNQEYKPQPMQQNPTAPQPQASLYQQPNNSTTEIQQQTARVTLDDTSGGVPAPAPHQDPLYWDGNGSNEYMHYYQPSGYPPSMQHPPIHAPPPQQQQHGMNGLPPLQPNANHPQMMYMVDAANMRNKSYSLPNAFEAPPPPQNARYNNYYAQGGGVPAVDLTAYQLGMKPGQLPPQQQYHHHQYPASSRKGYGLGSTPPGPKPRRKASKNGMGMDTHICTECGAMESPEWRKGPKGPKTLCNACGLRWAKKTRKESTSHQNQPPQNNAQAHEAAAIALGKK